MTTTLTITFQGMEPSPALRQDIERRPPASPTQPSRSHEP